MAYTTGTFNLVSQTLEGSTGTKLWRYTTTDSIATVLGASYVSDAVAKGVLAGDTVIVDITSGPTTYILKVSSVGTAAATLKGTDAQLAGTVQVGVAATDLVGFFAATPVSQPAGATQATLTATWVTLSGGSGFGFSSSDQIISVITAIQVIQSALKTLGLWKGSA